MIEWKDNSTPNVIERHDCINRLLDIAVIRDSKGIYIILINSRTFPSASRLLDNVKLEAIVTYAALLREELLGIS